MTRDLESALREARPYVQGVYHQLAFTNHQHVPAGVLARIDAALSAASGGASGTRRNTCEVCDEDCLSKCRSCSLSGEPNPEAFYREELVNALVVKYRVVDAIAPSEAPNVERAQLVERCAKDLFDRFAPDHMFYTTDDPNFARWRDYASAVLDRAEESFLAERRQPRLRITELENALDSARAEGIAAERERAAKAAEEWLSIGTMKLRAGELTAQEVRTVKAIVGAIVAAIREAKP